MEPLASQLTIYTSTARAIAPQNRLIASDESQIATPSGSSERQNNFLRGANYTAEKLRGSLGNASDLLTQASGDLSRIGDALDEVESLIEIAEENPNLSAQQRAQLNAQIDDYLTEIDDIAANSNYDGRNLLDQDQTISVQSGSSSDNQIDVELYASSSEDLATGLSSVDLSDNAGVSNARALVDEAQQSLRDREISLSADRGSLSIAQDQNRVAQLAGDNILQAQLAASNGSEVEDVRARISENLQAYLGNIATQLANQTVTVGGFSLPEPQPDPFLEQNDRPAFDPNAEDGTPFGTEFLGQASNRNTPPQSYRTTGFGGYDQGGNATSGNGGGAERQASRVSVDA
jgi:flagellin